MYIEWLPIESAPKDGTHILGVVSCQRLSFEKFLLFDIFSFQDGRWEKVFKDGWEKMFKEGKYYEFPSNLTHWIPLPTPKIEEELEELYGRREIRFPSMKIKWLPIKSAPKDGTPILGVTSPLASSFHIASFIDGCWRWCSERPPFHLEYYEGPSDPTHWIPIPEFEEDLSSLIAASIKSTKWHWFNI